MWLIVGLGNPGPKYELTRHNFGFLAVDALLDRLGISTTKAAFHGTTARFELDDQPCLALKPETFMNRSGTSVQAAMAFHKIALDHVIVIHDEIDIPLGELRIKKGGGAGGHNGIKDITRLVGGDFLRIRLGVGRPAIKGIEADYVLNPFHQSEIPVVETILEKSCDAVKTIIKSGLDVAQRDSQTKLQKTV